MIMCFDFERFFNNWPKYLGINSLVGTIDNKRYKCAKLKPVLADLLTFHDVNKSVVDWPKCFDQLIQRNYNWLRRTLKSRLMAALLETIILRY